MHSAIQVRFIQDWFPSAIVFCLVCVFIFITLHFCFSNVLLVFFVKCRNLSRISKEYFNIDSAVAAARANNRNQRQEGVDHRLVYRLNLEEALRSGADEKLLEYDSRSFRADGCQR